MPDKNKKIALTITANTRQLRQGMRRATGDVKTFERQITGLGQKMRNIRMRFQATGIFGRGGGMLRGAAGFAGVYGLQQMVSSAKEESAALTDIQITGNLTDKQLQKLRKSMFAVSDATGKSTSEVLSFVSAMTTATGDTAAAMVALEDIGKVAVATGTDMGALGQVFVKLTTSMKVLPREAGAAFNILRAQEKKGAITMAQLALVLPEVVGASGIMGASATGLQGVSAIGGLLQMTRRGTGSVEQAKTSSSRFLQDLYRNRKKVKKHLGVDIMDEGGNVRNLTTIFGELAVSLARPGMLGKSLEKAIFNVRSIKTATELQKAGLVGLGGKQGTLESFKTIFDAGKTDVISADFKTRMASPSKQFDVGLNVLKNTIKKPMDEIFKSLAKGIKEWGPDLVRTLKFLIENSSKLFKMWLGVKGAKFFGRLLAPVGGGGAVGAMAGGGGVMMTPGGQMVGAGGMGGGGMAARPGGMYLAPRGWRGAGVGTSPTRTNQNWVSAGRSGGMMEQAFWGTTGGQTAKPMGRMAQRFRGMGNVMAGGFMRGMGQFGGGGLRGAGMATGAMNAMGMFGSGKEGILGRGGSMAASMGLMSGNPALMAAAMGALVINDVSADIARVRAGKDSSLTGYAKSQAYGMQGTGKILSGVAGGFKDIYRRQNRFDSTLGANYGTWRGYDARNQADALIGQFGGFMGPGGAFGISPRQRMLLADKHGSKGLKTMQGKLGTSMRDARARAADALRVAKMPVTEENLMRNTQYAKLKDLYNALDKLILDIVSGKKISLILPVGTTPGQRVENNASVSQTFGSSAGMGVEYG